MHQINAGGGDIGSFTAHDRRRTHPLVLLGVGVLCGRQQVGDHVADDLDDTARRLGLLREQHVHVVAQQHQHVGGDLRHQLVVELQQRGRTMSQVEVEPGNTPYG